MVWCIQEDHRQASYSPKPIYSNNNRNTKPPRILHMLPQIHTSPPHHLHILLEINITNNLPRNNFRPSTMHLQSLHRSNQNRTVRNQPRRPALDVEELLHPNVGAKPGFRYDVAWLLGFRGGGHGVGSGEFEGDAVGDDGGVAVGDVCEGTGVDEDWCTLQLQLISISITSTQRWRQKITRAMHTSKVCIKFGLIASLISTVNAPPIPISSAVIGSPLLLLATTIRPNLHAKLFINNYPHPTAKPNPPQTKSKSTLTSPSYPPNR